MSIVFFYSCNHNSNLQNELLKHNSDTIKIKHVLEISEIKKVPNNEDSIWVFQRLKDMPYPYDTILSGGYYLKHKVFKDTESSSYLQSLTLMSSKKKIKEFGSFTYGIPYKNIGYIGADFDNLFVLVYSFGSGNPHMIDLIEKKTGRTIKSGTWVDVDEKEQILLYIENEFDNNQRLIIYDIKNDKEIISKDFQNTKCTERVIGGLRNCVKIDTVTSNEIVLKIEAFEDSIIKKYYR